MAQAMEQMMGEDYEAEIQGALSAASLSDGQEDCLAEIKINADEQVNKSLRAVRYWRAEREAIEAQAKTEIDRIMAWAEHKTSRIDRRINWHERGLRSFLWATGKKTLNMAYGTLKRIAGRDRVEVRDFEAFRQWNDENDVFMVRVKMEPDKTAIAKHIKETGEIPNGCDLLTGEDTFKIVVDE